MTISPDLHNIAREPVGRETTVPPSTALDVLDLSAALEHFPQLAFGPLQHMQPAFRQIFASPVDVECQH